MSDDKIGESFEKLKNLKSYYHLVVDAQGETSMAQRDFSNAEDQASESLFRLTEKIPESFGKPSGISFTKLQGDEPWHNCPSPQLVFVLSGEWWVKTNDGKTTNFKAGDVLWQDNCEDHPAFEKGSQKTQHYSGTPDNVACDQVILSIDMVNGPVPDSANKPGPF
jgi:hypothetical protein